MQNVSKWSELVMWKFEWNACILLELADINVKRTYLYCFSIHRSQSDDCLHVTRKGIKKLTTPPPPSPQTPFHGLLYLGYPTNGRLYFSCWSACKCGFSRLTGAVTLKTNLTDWLYTQQSFYTSRPIIAWWPDYLRPTVSRLSANWSNYNMTFWL